MLVSDVIDRVYSEWLEPAGINKPDWTQLNGGIGNSAATATVTDSSTVPDHALVEIDSELILTGSNTATTLTLNERGYRETSAASHTDGTKVLIMPDFPRITVFNSIVSIISELYAWGLYRRATATLSASSSAPVNLASNALDVISARVQNSSTSIWQKLRKGWDYEVLNDVSPAQVQFYSGVLSGSNVRIVYKSDFTAPSSESDDVTTTCGVPSTLAPYLPMGVAGYLLMGREVPRVLVEEIRRQLAAQDVPVGNTLSVGQALLNSFRNTYVSAERNRQIMQDRIGKVWVS